MKQFVNAVLFLTHQGSSLNWHGAESTLSWNRGPKEWSSILKSQQNFTFLETCFQIRPGFSTIDPLLDENHCFQIAGQSPKRLLNLKSKILLISKFWAAPPFFIAKLRSNARDLWHWGLEIKCKAHEAK